MARRYTTAASLAAAHRDLLEKHALLEKQFDKLRGGRFSIAAHQRYLRKIKAHLQALHRHTEALRLEGERQHEQRELLHASRPMEAPHGPPDPRPRRKRRASKP